jgi:penicillin-binding protein 1C
MTFKVAAKTGTSSSYRDNWALGYTPEFTVAVWAGNFDRTPMQGVSGVTGAAPILADVFATLRESFGPTTWFERPEGIEAVRIDPRTGKRLTAQSPAARLSQTDWLLSETLPPAATAADYDAQGRAFLPLEYRDWITRPDNRLADLVTLAPEAPATLRILQPLDGAVYHLDPDLPGQGRQLALRATPMPGQSAAHWSSPTLTITQGVAGQTTVSLTPGTHVLRLHAAPDADPVHEVSLRVIQD